MQLLEEGGGAGAGGGGGGGDGRDTGTDTDMSRGVDGFRNNGEDLTWMNLTVEDGDTIMNGDLMSDAIENMDMPERNTSQAQHFEVNYRNVSIESLFPPASMPHAPLPSTELRPVVFQIGAALTNEIANFSSIPTTFSTIGANLSQTETLPAVGFSGSAIDQHDASLHLADPMETNFLDFPTPEPFRNENLEFAVPNEELDAGFTYLPNVELVPAESSLQAASAEASVSVSPSSTARGLYPGFFSKPNLGIHGDFGW